MRTELRHYAGSSLRGPHAEHGGAASKPAEGAESREAAPHAAPFFVRFELLALERQPIEELTALGARAELIVATRGGSSVRPYRLLNVGAAIGEGTQAAAFLERVRGGSFGRTITMANFLGALPESVTATFTATPMPLEAGITGAADRGIVEWAVSRRAGDRNGQYFITLMFEDWIWSREVEELSEANEPRRPGYLRQTEFVVFEEGALRAGAEAVFVMKTPFDTGGAPALLARLRIEEGAGAVLSREQSVALLRCNREIDESRAQVAARSRLFARGELDTQQLRDALAAIEIPEFSRKSLMFLSGLSSAEIASDFALTATDEMLVEFIHDCAGEAREIAFSPESSAEDLGLYLEKETLRALASSMQRDDPPDSLLGLLVKHSGDASSDPEALVELLQNAKTLVGLREGLVAMNRESLRDPNINDRVRAYDWLRARNCAPAKFDPFASLADRVRAIDEDEASRGGR